MPTAGVGSGLRGPGVSGASNWRKNIPYKCVRKNKCMGEYVSFSKH